MSIFAGDTRKFPIEYSPVLSTLAKLANGPGRGCSQCASRCCVFIVDTTPNANILANGDIYTHPEIGLEAGDWLTINRNDVEAGDWMIKIKGVDYVRERPKTKVCR